MVTVVLVGRESDQGQVHTCQVLRPDQHIEVLVRLAFEPLNQPREHGCPGVEDVELRHQPDGNGVVRVGEHLVLGSHHVGLEARDLNIGCSSQFVGNSTKGLLERVLVKHGENGFTKADGTH